MGNKVSGRLSSAFTKLGGVMAAAFAIDKIGDFISSCIELAAKADGIRTAFNRLNDPSLLSRLREATKGTVSDLQLMQTAAKSAKLRNEIEGVKIEIKKTNDEIAKNGDKTGELKNKVEGLNLKLGELEGELNSAGDAFGKLGINVKNADGSTKSFSALLLETADRFKVMPEGAEKTALAMELFGRSGKDLLPVLNLGKDGIEQMMKRADELGLTLNQKTIGAVNRFITSQKDLKDSSDALKIAVGTLTAPVLVRFNEGLNGVLQKLVQTEGPVKDVTAGVLAVS